LELEKPCCGAILRKSIVSVMLHLESYLQSRRSHPAFKVDQNGDSAEGAA
jgi:hypothetical protein